MRLAANRIRVRNEAVAGLGLARPQRLMYASDLHIGLPWTTPALTELTTLVRELAPDILLLGGDLCETRAGLDAMSDWLGGVTRYCPVYAIAGNHDERVGVDRVRRAIETSGGHWLRSASLDGLHLHADARSAPSAQRHVLVAHHPNAFDVAAARGFRLVLAGHLHGGQRVLLTHRRRLYPGALFARYTGLEFNSGRTTMFVSRGVADVLPLRFNCPREVILCTLT